MNQQSVKDVVPPPLAGGGRRSQCIMASGEIPSCSCGTWYCCSRGIREMQEFAESFFWSNPVLSSPPVPPVPQIQRPLTSGAADVEEEEEISGEPNDTVGKNVEGNGGNHLKTEGGDRSADYPMDKVVNEEGGGGFIEVIGGEDDGGENLKEGTEQKSKNGAMEYDYTLYDELPPDLENMMDCIQGPPPDVPPVLDVEMSEDNGEGERELPDIQPEDGPFDLIVELLEVSSCPPSPIMGVPIEPPPILTPALIQQLTPPPKLTVQKLINFVRNSPLYDQSTASKTTAPPLGPPSPSLPILESNSAPPPPPSQPQLSPVPSCSSPQVPPNLRKNRAYFCKICDKSYATQRSFDMHLWRHRKCKGCRAQFTTPSVSKSSSSAFSLMDNYCEICATNLKKSPPPSLLKQSKDNDSGHQDQEEEVMSCPECSKKFKYKKRFDAHMLLHEADLTAQMKSQEEKKKFQCSVCDKWFGSKNHLDLHVTSIHKSGVEEGEFKCVICKKSFGSQRGLRAHQRNKSVCYYKMKRMENIQN